VLPWKKFFVTFGKVDSEDKHMNDVASITAVIHQNGKKKMFLKK
jgi:hypothetical protein